MNVVRDDKCSDLVGILLLFSVQTEFAHFQISVLFFFQDEQVIQTYC